ncbi:flagellar basal body L-ring protein FlgH [Atopomonas sediminilitoris]|uniref:flagellar basal body L-ring protein FlgH n=1 Tax=Atopomonas sediminilitoris TaxID=2919919 RepID=UPI001F4E0782|nr:flagellar basal body L-ring protein FlgH [Atopomonas sediminilitoris]MCJ8167966.1 flagellar basal body L-ring protein FlgH [Atopomonas sediminilitoris]
MSRFLVVLALAVSLAGCVTPPPKPDDAAFAPVLPRTPVAPQSNSGAIYQAGFEMNLYDDRKAYRVGDIITITLDEKMAASKKADSGIDKKSTTNIGVPTILGMTVSPKNPLSGLGFLGAENDRLGLNSSYSGDRSFEGESEAGQSNSLTGSITVTVSDVMPNGVLAIRGEKWMTLNTGDELIRIQGLIRSDDIAQDNTVPSTRVADARITYSGTGAFADASQPGWLDRFFLSPLWPF